MATLRGKVVAGRRIASDHIASASDELEIIIGERPYPGSLNVLLDQPTKLSDEAATYFDGGQRLLWPAHVNGTKVWLYRWRNAPLHILELIAPFSLRERFGFAQGGAIEIDVDAAILVRVPRVSWALLWKGRERLAYTSDRYDHAIGLISGMTGLGIDSLPRAISRTAKGILRKARFNRSRRPYRFSRLHRDAEDDATRETRHIYNLLNYTKTSNSDYSAQRYPAGYHTIQLRDRKLAGQRDPAARLASVPMDFADKSVLDLGSNQGGMLLQLADRLKWGVGVDYDHRMVNAANRIRWANGASKLNFYVFDLQSENLQIIRDFLPEQRADVCFLLSVCMWLKNWREVIEFTASVAEAVLFESNGTPVQQREQIEHLRKVWPNVTLLSEESEDDADQRNRKLLLARR
jgi:SAM-dependent methyltransferase